MADSDLIAARIAELGADRTSGAAALMSRAVSLVQQALAARVPMASLAPALCRAQPSMAPFWVLAAEALAAERDAQRFDRFVQRLGRSRAALVRIAVDYLAPPGERSLAIVTMSASASVASVIEALARHHRVRVSCSDSRPALEGRRLAAQLSATGVPVTLYSDSAIAHALADADAVLVGADAVAPAWVLNKSGTLMLAAAAVHAGVPVYVVATRDKFVAEPIAARLTLRDESPDEVWDAAPAAVAVRNPYFERTPAELVAAVISDMGVLGTGMLPDACASSTDVEAVRALLALLDR